MDDTKLSVTMMDLWVTDGEMRVLLNDGENGYNRDIVLAVARTASGARTKAKRKLRAILNQLEAMD